jgi:hypothetical protein
MPIDNFPFTEIGGGRSSPLLRIRIINPHTGLSFLTSGLIDTGADQCAIPALFAPLLGHKYFFYQTSKINQTDPRNFPNGFIPRSLLRGMKYPFTFLELRD